MRARGRHRKEAGKSGRDILSSINISTAGAGADAEVYSGANQSVLYCTSSSRGRG